MCGICGVLSPHHSIPKSIVQRMNTALTHRGPDGEGYFWGDTIALAMRRLSIIDLAGSDQPLYNEDRTIVLVFNGEIFNFRALRHDLRQKGHTFATEGDGETIVHLYEEYGIDAPKFLRGQFAFSLWDSQHKRLLLGRDITGEKPLFYSQRNGVFVWGSEIKAVLQHPLIEHDSAFTDAGVLADYLTYGYIPTPKTAYRHIMSVPPAHTLLWENDTVTLNRYWQLPTSAPDDPHAQSEDYLPELRRLLDESVQMTMVADVPLGAFLSGGLDSSLVVALMQRHAVQSVQTFSIGFEGDDSFDETHYAQQVAQHLGTKHTAFTVKPDMMTLLPSLVAHHDQPFGDSSALPTYLVSQLTRQHVTVALTGDGGDELFAGYERFYAAQLRQKLAMFPKVMWTSMANVLEAIPEGTGYYNVVKRGGRFAKAASLPLGMAYLDWVRVFSPSDILALCGQTSPHEKAYADSIRHLPDLLTTNFSTYLPDDLLVKTDRMTMMASLEGRAPFLVQELVEFAFRVPFNLKLHGSTTKHILKEAARGILPNSIIDRPKHGFGVPIGAWLRRDMAWVRAVLVGADTPLRGLLDIAPLEGLLKEHEQQRDHAKKIWALLTLAIWLKR
jgi:asparagine synthase (glutamine-hydrolysing)